jgi:phosphoenolpyruvate-protein phosphotransferase (PTS system enzyme I)
LPALRKRTPETLRLSGTPASPGLARGALVIVGDLDPVGAEAVAGGDPAAALRAALEQAARQLTQLAAGVREDQTAAAAILELQTALLEDPVMTDPAFEAIAAGASPEKAWLTAAELQIRDYREAADPYFRARTADLIDLRDRVLRCLRGTAAAVLPGDAILIARDLPPSRFLEISWCGGGIALHEGSPQSHLSMLARARGVPMLVGVPSADLAAHREALLDADRGDLVASPDPVVAREFASRQSAALVSEAAERSFRSRPAQLPSGERVLVQINVNDVGELPGLDAGHCDGVGLVRTELLLRRMADLTDEELQFEAYRRVMTWAEGKPVTIRTLDAGADKPIAGYTVAGESNPFLGVRGLRLSLRKPEILTVQLRALARAAALGPLKVMAPMVTLPGELERFRRLMAEAVRSLQASGVDCRTPSVGMMVEVPAAAVAIDLFETDFVSIGSNDLVQYLTACSRDSAELAALQDPLQPGVMRLIRAVIEHARIRGIEVSVCGDMASDPRYVPALLEVGLRCFSVGPAALGRVKKAICAAEAAED